MATEYEQLIQQSQFADQVDRFFGSDLGKYLAQRADDEVEMWTAALKKVDPVDANQIRTIQNNIYRAEQVLVWLADAILAGENARDQLQIMDAID